MVRRFAEEASVPVAVVLVFLVGFVGCAAFFSDPGPGAELWRRTLVTTAIYVLGCAGIGALLEERWYVALLSSFGPMLEGVEALANFVLGSAAGSRGTGIFVVAGLVLTPSVSLLSSYAGARIRRRCENLVRQRRRETNRSASP
jgi:hypothetical protein